MFTYRCICALALSVVLQLPVAARESCETEAYRFLSQGLTLVERHQGRKALKQAQSWVNGRPSDDWSYALRARIYCQMDENEAALSDAQTALSIEPKNVLALTTKAVCAMRLNRRSEAIKLNDKAYSLQPDNQYVLDDRVEILTCAGRIEQVKKLLERALTAKPKDAVKRGRYIRLLVGEGNYEKVVEQTSILLSQYPKFKNRYYFLSFRGDAYRKTGRLRLAERDYTEAQRLNSLCLESYRGLIEIYRLTGNQSALLKEQRKLKQIEAGF